MNDDKYTYEAADEISVFEDGVGLTIEQIDKFGESTKILLTLPQADWLSDKLLLLSVSVRNERLGLGKR